MKPSILVIAAMLLAPAPAAAQPHWNFEVPFDVESINQDVSLPQILCAVFGAPPNPQNPIVGPPSMHGFGESSAIPLDGQGDATGVMLVPVTSNQRPGEATHYACWLWFDGGYPSESDPLITRRSRSGTELVPLVSGELP